MSSARIVEISWSYRGVRRYKNLYDVYFHSFLYGFLYYVYLALINLSISFFSFQVTSSEYSTPRCLLHKMVHTQITMGPIPFMGNLLLAWSIQLNQMPSTYLLKTHLMSYLQRCPMTTFTISSN